MRILPTFSFPTRPTKLVLIGLVGFPGALLAEAPAAAASVDRPFFRADRVVVLVHPDEAGVGNRQDTIVKSFQNLQSDDVADRHGTFGAVLPILPAQNGFTPNLPVSSQAQIIWDASDVDDDGVFPVRMSQFLVASNAPFDIFASAHNLQATGGFSGIRYDDISFSFDIVTYGEGWGSRAQDPSVGGAGILHGTAHMRSTLADLSGPSQVKLFEGGRRTAQKPGTLVQQSVGFEAHYTLSPRDVRVSSPGELSADITYTIYAP